ncbi:multidrug ABC transporter ATP-binding protein [Pseudoclavibacter sp. RFBJ3]|uniref:ABC transporter ATP-binding protein n=1 Tax=unclassified Pseudoclavibacter TaxID=2615177 RepID=UPI000CE83DE9|nr:MULTISPECIES: ABC transporter ATP-binding protein [unclassified Pseudoclavibacter]PPF82515.1 multidrug ABC transporter ATP-binding protein [Pseudoclavibacter sp. RFBJ5]PPF91408.1 multidrug ABC transporter ATP-binding protein [Pseudoclavibacter sp. RFBJ3]PPF96333.1 multidrug ABC transporter ATP-binding protein [Pseudoclavibacter sp. RFBH5]PPG22079.1 multidrug ABC transporter ATP-binding protein [Pseudoclavibacter sp. RFBI4]
MSRDADDQNQDAKGARRGKRRPKEVVEKVLTEEEQLELELAEQARQSSGDWDSVAPGKAKNFGQSFGRLLGRLRPYRAALIIVSFLGAVGVVLSVIAPRVLGQATNLIFEGVVSSQLPAGASKDQVVAGLRDSGQTQFADMVAAMDITPGEGVDFERLGMVLLSVLALYVFSALLMWLQGYVINIIMMKAMYKLREDVERKINALPLSYFDRVQRGELLSRVTNDIDNITQTMQQSLSQVVTSVLTVVGVLVMMFSISWQLALVALVTLPLMGVIFGVIGPKSQRNFAEQWKKTGRLNARVEESFSGHALVRVFGREKDAREQFQVDNEQLFQAAFKAQFWAGVMMPAMMFIGNLSYVGIAVLGGLMVAGGNLRLGDVQAFIQYSQQFTQPLAELGGMAAVLQSGTASAERVFELLDEDEQEPDASDAPKPANGAGEIVFDDVTFSYTPEQKLIENLNFSVEPGQTVAIVGPTGAGKSTLVNLIMRFYELDGGRILLDGQDIAELRREDVRSRTGMVLQDPWLFAGSIRENIRYGRQDATDEEVLAAATACYVDRFVHSLPEGYDTVLDEDASNVSAGERQLITIARAFVSDPQVLILDEATSSVDTRTELLLQQAMAALRQGRTSFVIAHRLSTIRDADLILVMEHGSIVEQGTHDELVKQGGAYARLYNSQFEQAVSDLDAEQSQLTS